MSADDRMMYLTAQDAWAAGKHARPEPAVDQRTHADEIHISHQGAPSVAEQDRSHGAGIPPVDNGPDPRGGAR